MNGYRWIVFALTLATAIVLAVAIRLDTDIRDTNVEVAIANETAVPDEAGDLREATPSEGAQPPQVSDRVVSEADLIDDHGMLASRRTREIANSDQYETLLRTLANAPEGRLVRSYLHPKILNVVHDFGGTVVMTAFRMRQDGLHSVVHGARRDNCVFLRLGTGRGGEILRTVECNGRHEHSWSPAARILHRRRRLST